MIEHTLISTPNLMEKPLRKVFGFLCPWRQTFKRLELDKKWWHRMAVVLFFVVLIPTLLSTWMIGDDSFPPKNSYNNEIHHWVEFKNGPPGVMADIDSWRPIEGTNASPPNFPVIQKTVELPDRTTASFPGTVSDDSIRAQWDHKRALATAKAASIGFGIAILVTAIFSYLLQACYRALLYVIYGARANQEN